MSYPIALAFYPPSHSKQGNSGGRPSINGIRELAASSRNSRYVTIPLVVSYTTFSPLPRRDLTRKPVSIPIYGGCFLLSTPTVTNSFYFQKWSILCCPDFPLAYEIMPATEPGHCFLPAKIKENKGMAK